MQVKSTITALAAVYTQQSQRIHTAHSGGWPPSSPPSTTGASRFPVQSPGALLDHVELSDEARSLVQLAPEDPRVVKPALMDDLQDRLLAMMLERLTGLRAERRAARFPQSTADALGWFAERYGVPRAPRHRPQNFSAQMASIAARSETSHFASSAILQTSDGQELNLDVQLSMAHSSLGVSFSGVRASDTHLVDPMVVAFQGSAAQVTQTSFHFQLGVAWSGLTTSGFDSGDGHATSETDAPSVDVLGQRREPTAPETGRGARQLTAFAASTNSIQRAFFRAVNTRLMETRATRVSSATSESATEIALEESRPRRRGAADGWNRALAKRSGADGEAPRPEQVHRWVA